MGYLGGYKRCYAVFHYQLKEHYASHYNIEGNRFVYAALTRFLVGVEIDGIILLLDLSVGWR